MKSFRIAFSALAGIGFVLSLAVHLASLAGIALFGGSAFALHGGIFVVWIPTAMVVHRHSPGITRNDFGKAALRGCLPWMRVLIYALLAYTIVNFFYVFFIGAGVRSNHSGTPDAATLRGFSGHWMLFYFTALCVLYSNTRVGAARQCRLGHPLDQLADFCEQCGSPVR